MRAAVLWALLFATAASAEATQIPGRGRITLLPGYNYTPDRPFYEHVSYNLGTTAKNNGAPTLWASFAYGATESIEAAIDLFGLLQSIPIEGRDPLTKLSYGAALGARFVFPVELGSLHLEPHLAAGVMGTLINVQAGGLTGAESFVTGYQGGAGIELHVSEAMAVGLEYRFLYARGLSPQEIHGTIDGGGHFLLASISWFFPGEPPHQSGEFR